MLSRVAGSVGGTIARVFRRSAEREAAFRFVENESVTSQQLLSGAAHAALGRVVGTSFYVVLDFCFLTLASAAATALGPVGTGGTKALGLVAMNALAIGFDGTPLGLLAQEYFARSPKLRARGGCARCRRKLGSTKSRKRCHHQNEARRALPLEQKETRFWLSAIVSVLATIRQVGLAAKPWFQCDRGADFWELLVFAAGRTDFTITVRGSANRLLTSGQNIRTRLLRTSVRYRKQIKIPAGPDRPARVATVVVRAAQVEVRNKLRRNGTLSLGAVWVREVGPTPDGANRLDWLLWTTHPLVDDMAVAEVVMGYQRRWGIEEFHKVWKSVMGVEQMQLRSRNALTVWATLLAMAAARAQRLVKRARTEPDAPASTEFSNDELIAVLTLAEGTRNAKPATLTLANVVGWVAELGGYNKYSRGPPGAITVSRGLEDIRTAAAVVAFMRDKGMLKM